MSLKPLITTFIVLAAATTTSFSQTPQEPFDVFQRKLLWVSGNVRDLQNGEEFAFACSFKSFPNDRIEWIQKDGEIVHTFLIASSEGTWPATGSEGEAVFHITYDGSPGRIAFKRDGEKISISLDLTERNPNGSAYTFTVSQVARLND